MRRKRLFDLALVLATLPFWLPLLALLALAVLLVLGRPVLFVQERPGLHGRPFRLVKLRTMREAYDALGNPLPDAARMTRLGAFLRASSLDELPDLWNVLKGEMSLVGPRPLLVEYLPWYTADEARRHDVPPGITGWAQINGRNALSWKEKLALDLFYVDNRSLRFDLRILLRTICATLRREGISHEGYTTMPRFDDERRREREAQGG